MLFDNDEPKKFYHKKNGKVIWKIIHRLLKTTNTMLKANASELNNLLTTPKNE